MNNKNLRVALAAALLVMLAGCTTLEYVPINRSRPEELRKQLAVGETVHVRLQSGDRRQFRISALDADGMIGRADRVAYKDIDLLEVETRDYSGTAKTVLVAGGIAVAFVALAVLEAEIEKDSQPATRCVSNGRGGTICTPE